MQLDTNISTTDPTMRLYFKHLVNMMITMNREDKFIKMKYDQFMQTEKILGKQKAAEKKLQRLEKMRTDFGGELQANQIIEQNMESLKQNLKDIVEASPEKKARIMKDVRSLIIEQPSEMRATNESDSEMDDDDTFQTAV